jgi:hypothetical protein
MRQMIVQVYNKYRGINKMTDKKTEIRGLTEKDIFIDDAAFIGEMQHPEIKPRELQDGEMLHSVPITEIDPNATEKDIDFVDEKEQPMNIFEREALLKMEGGKEKVEDDILYNKISDMSDEELRAAIAEETTDIKEGDGSASSLYDKVPESKTVNSLMIDSLTEEELMELYNVAVRAQADPNLNVAAELPKRMYDIIFSNCRALQIKNVKTINRYARMVVMELMQEMSLDKECKAFQDELSKAMAFPEIVDMYAEHTRNIMEVSIIAQADTTTDEELKKVLLETSKAYTDAYTFERQLKLLENDVFIRGLAKKIKRYERACDSFDFVMGRSILRTIHIKNLLIELPHVLKLNENQCKAFIVMLAEVTKNIKPDDKPGVWFMYSSVRNIVTLARTGTTKTAFSIECIEKLKNLFSVLEKRQTELFSV